MLLTQVYSNTCFFLLRKFSSLFSINISVVQLEIKYRKYECEEDCIVPILQGIRPFLHKIKFENIVILLQIWKQSQVSEFFFLEKSYFISLFYGPRCFLALLVRFEKVFKWRLARSPRQKWLLCLQLFDFDNHQPPILAFGPHAKGLPE